MTILARAVLLATMLLALPHTARAEGGSTGATCQTGNGPRTLMQLANEVAAVGYSGPWDPDSIAAAYASASTSGVDCVVSAADVSRPLAVLLIAALYLRAPVAENSARAERLAQAGISVSAWGNTNDCFYDVVLCAPIARSLVGGVDAGESQWLGIPLVVRKSYPFSRVLAGISASHTTILERAATELAAELVA